MTIRVKLNEESDIFSILSDFFPIWEKEDIDFLNVQLDYTFGNHIDGEIFTLILSIVNELRALGNPVDIEIVGIKDCLPMPYTENIGFFKRLENELSPITQLDYPNLNFIEITHLAPEVYNLNDAFLDIFDRHFDLSPENLNSLVFVFDELICNTTRHCQSKNGGYYFCQKNKNRNTVEVIIVDSGIGIQKSLNRAFPHYNELTCLEECIKFGVTCGDGRGHGLYFISELLKRNKGEFICVSGFSNLSINNGEQKAGKNAYYKGTIVKCVFNMNNILPIEELLDEQNYSK